MHKAQLRDIFLQKRLAMPESEWRTKSERLVELMLAWMNGQTFDHYILYRSFRREPSLERLAAILPTECTYYPRIQGKAMNFYATDSSFIPNRFGLEEPPPDPSRELKDFSTRTLLIIPALAYDLSCYRLGYGGGYFDRFLASAAPVTLGVCLDPFIVEELPHEAHDHAVETVITDRRLLTGTF